MKTIGLLGGMSWESTLEYYRIINERMKSKLGGEHSAEVVIYSFDFYDIVKLQEEGDWKRLEDMMVKAGEGLKEAGADFLLICANTMNKMADSVEERVGLPVIHIGDATAEVIKKRGMDTVGLVGTRYVMEGEFYRRRMKDRHGIEVLVPEQENREKVHDIIYNELCKGQVKEKSKDSLLKMIQELVDRGAEGIILGCTEIPLYITEEDVDIPLFDTTAIHAEAAVDRAFEDD
ncbi:MAG: aspartate/glutamate racemase family protein [Candidatus Thermoplasmatota archaeon]|nr:aspartate/glutamate racemase family protein [Candidatus Thermoplasmatota archaeon]MBS3789951.1 aspartate/glutamate racemase family protein [Candidatus Thermoplasmatota archaeon]